LIPSDFIRTLIDRVDIVDVIDKYVKLKKAGANYMARCPFHNEKSPSFSVSPTKQIYYCFGCGASGNAIGFVMEYAGEPFVDAVKDLAQTVGLAVPEVRREQLGYPNDPNGSQDYRPAPTQEVKTSLQAINRIAFDFYRAELRRSPKAIDYFKSRGVSGDIAARFGLGYAPSGWQSLESVFPEYQDVSLVEVGLVIESTPDDADDPKADQSKPTRRYDRFRDRVMFPIFDTRGAIIGFGGRVFGDEKPKYLNSPETPLFEKGRELYGLYQARKAIRDLDRVIVVEGYMDVIALHQNGVEVAVATLGTACTEHHMQKLFRLTDTVVFSFDGDAAGQKAAWRALETALPVFKDGKEIKFLFLPEEHDPDSYVREFGPEQFSAAMDAAKPLSQVLIDRLVTDHNISSAEGKGRFFEAAKPLVAQIQAPMLRRLLEEEIAKILGFARSELARMIPQATRKFDDYDERTDYAPTAMAPRKIRSDFARIVARLLDFPALVSRLPVDLMDQSQFDGLREIAQFMGEADHVTTGQAMAMFPEGIANRLIQDALREPLAGTLTIEDAAAELDEFAAEQRAQARQQVLIELNSQRALSTDERQELAQLSMRTTGV
jgi:DNA primase